MKKILYIIYFLSISYLAQSQNKLAFSEISHTNIDLSESLKSYKILELTEDVQTIGDGETLTVEFVKAYSFVLKENKLLAKDYSVTIKSENKVESKTIYDLGFDGSYYMNANATIDSQMTMTVFKNQYAFFIKDSNHEFYIEPLTKFDKSASKQYYVYYEIQNIINDSNIHCAIQEKNQSDFVLRSPQTIEPTSICKTVELNFCLDYSFYATYNSINEAINRTLEILNLTQLDFTIANGLAYDVIYKVKSHYIITCIDCNFWPTTGAISTNFFSFQNYNNYAPMFEESSDIKVFWQAELPPYDINGYGLLCDYTFICAQEITTRTVALKNFISATGTNKTRLVLSHEFGHNFGCPHTIPSIDPPSIMSGGDGYQGNLWASPSIVIINESLTLSDCFSDCVSELCINKRVEDAVVNIDSPNGVINFSWLSEPNIEYKVRLYDYATEAWTNYITLNYPSNNVDFNFGPQTTSCWYRIEIIPICSGVRGNISTILFKNSHIPSPVIAFESTIQDETLCSGETYTFSVTTTNPGSNPSYIWLIGGTLRGTEATLTTPIYYSNNNMLLSCRITNTELCTNSQTFLVSKTLSVTPQPCSLSNNEFENQEIKYFPNPVKDIFTISSLRNIKSIGVYNILGQKIQEHSINKNQAITNFSELPNSTYLVKVEFENYLKIIKIIKI